MIQVAAMLLGPARALPPPGVDHLAYADALAEDTYEVLAGLAGAQVAIVSDADQLARAHALTWPGTPVLTVPDPADRVRGALRLLLGDADLVVVVSDDVPDLPALLIGKLFAALASHDVAFAPAEDGGLVAVGARRPLPQWFPSIDLHATRAAGEVRSAAPARAVAPPTPGWHRLQIPSDIARLDVGLSGWPATRALLGG